MLRKIITATIATAVIASAAIAVPTEANAYGRHGGGVGLGIAAGVVGGAIIGGAIANQGYYGSPVYEDNYYGCHRVLFRDDDGRQFWRRVCN